MDMKEAKGFIEEVTNIGIPVIQGEKVKFGKIIKLLQRGEKFEEMWKEIYRDFIKNKEERNISGYSYMVDMQNIKQKYFPKEDK